MMFELELGCKYLVLDLQCHCANLDVLALRAVWKGANNELTLNKEVNRNAKQHAQ